MKIRPTLAALILVTLGASIAAAEPSDQAGRAEKGKYRAFETTRCPADRPWAVVLLRTNEDAQTSDARPNDEGSLERKREILSCHASEKDARKQLTELRAVEAQAEVSQPSVEGMQGQAATGQPRADVSTALEPKVEEPTRNTSTNEIAGTSSTSSTAAAVAVAATAGSDAGDGLFVLRCGSSHLEQVDPIVAPGTASAHLHEFFGNRSTNANSTYQSMIAGGTTCPEPGDTAGYWSPALIGPNSTVVRADGISAYYKNDPVTYGLTVPFPRDLRMIAGGAGSSLAVTFWSCKSEGVKYTSAPKCGDGTFPRAIVHFPQCWDGVRLDSPDHRSHVAYPRKGACPATHPVKIPHLKLYIRYSPSIGGPGYVFSDGMTLPHADFWNTWQQSTLEGLVRQCLNAGVNCGKQ